MQNKLDPQNPREGSALHELLQTGRLAVRLFTDRRTPRKLKAIPVLALAYLIFPFDFLPDLVPGLGQLDDLALIAIALRFFIHLAPEALVDELSPGRRAVGGGLGSQEPMPADYRVHDKV